MATRLTVQEVNSVPRNGRVRDYDQLETKAKQYLTELTDAESQMTVPLGVVECFDSSEIINYTEYIRVTV